MSHLKGKVAVITGSTSGIGKGIAYGLAKHGVHVVINGFGEQEDIQNILQDIRELGVEALYHDADMTRPDQIKDLIKTALSKFGQIDILVNNAGIQHVASIDEFPDDKWEAILDIDLKSSFYTIKHSLPSMKEHQWGRIISIVSAHGLVASPYKSAYVAAKHGMLGLTKTVALEVAEQGITCNAICPGYVKTPLVENQIADQAKSRGISEEAVVNDVLLKAQATKKFVTIDQIASYVLFLCGDDAENITGAAQVIDGGWTAA